MRFGFVQNNAQESIESSNIDVRREGLIKVGCLIYAKEDANYNGSVILTLIDNETKERIPLSTYPNSINLANASDGVTIMSGWLKDKDLKLINNRLYRLALIANIDGKEQDLWPKKGFSPTRLYLNGSYIPTP